MVTSASNSGTNALLLEKKMRMICSKILHGGRWNKLKQNLPIDEADHQSLCLHNTREHLRSACRHWRQTKQKAPDLREEFLQERAEDYVIKMRTDQETALKMIKKNGRSEENIHANQRNNRI
jgi:hypothetical protein